MTSAAKDMRPYREVYELTFYASSCTLAKWLFNSVSLLSKFEYVYTQRRRNFTYRRFSLEKQLHMYMHCIKKHPEGYSKNHCFETAKNFRKKGKNS